MARVTDSKRLAKLMTSQSPEKSLGWHLVAETLSSPMFSCFFFLLGGTEILKACNNNVEKSGFVSVQMFHTCFTGGCWDILFEKKVRRKKEKKKNVSNFTVSCKRLPIPASIHRLTLHLPWSLLILSGTPGVVLIILLAGGNKPGSMACLGTAI